MRRAARLIRCLPSGAVLAVALFGLIHFVCGRSLPEPVARAGLRHKVDVLTRHARPALLLAGDSRVRCGLIPERMAEDLGLPSAQVVNLAEVSCDSCATRAVFDEFVSRFADRPTMLLGVSLASVNDHSPKFMGEEMLWRLSLAERCRRADLDDALAACFLPEKAIWNRCTAFWPSEDLSLAHDGFFAEGASRNLQDWSEQKFQTQITMLFEQWFTTPCVDGWRWRLFRDNVQSLTGRGVQVIILDLPRHPRLEAAVAAAAFHAADNQFHRQLQQLGVPLIRCPPDWLGNVDPNTLYLDLLHLNSAGADLYTAAVATALRELAKTGRVVLAAPPATLAKLPKGADPTPSLTYSSCVR